MDEGEGAGEGGVDCGFVLFELGWGWRCDYGNEVALDC